MATTGPNQGPLTEINVTPLVDVILVLLIIFMLTAPILYREAIPLELPRASSGRPVQAATIGVVVTAEGAWLLDGAPCDARCLDRHLASYADPGTVEILVAADRRVPHGTVVTILDLARRRGVTRYALNIDPAAVTAPTP